MKYKKGRQMKGMKAAKGMKGAAKGFDPYRHDMGAPAKDPHMHQSHQQQNKDAGLPPDPFGPGRHDVLSEGGDETDGEECC